MMPVLEPQYEQKVLASGPAPSAAAQPEYSSVKRRTAAMLLDALIEGGVQSSLAVTVVVATELWLAYQGQVVGESQLDSATDLAIWAFGIAASLANQVVIQAYTGGTLGKHLMGIEVKAQNGLAPLGLKRALVRYIGRWISVASLGIGFAAALWTARKQALHDMLAQTIVVRKHARENYDVGYQGT